MESSEQQRLDDDELERMLSEWKTPALSSSVRARVFQEAERLSVRGPRWNMFWTGSIRIPFPVAYALAVALFLGGWRWITPPPAKVLVKTEIRTERVDVPKVTEHVSTRIVYRDRLREAKVQTESILRPVTQLRARIIRSGDAEN